MKCYLKGRIILNDFDGEVMFASLDGDNLRAQWEPVSQGEPRARRKGSRLAQAAHLWRRHFLRVNQNRFNGCSAIVQPRQTKYRVSRELNTGSRIPEQTPTWMTF